MDCCLEECLAVSCTIKWQKIQYIPNSNVTAMKLWQNGQRMKQPDKENLLLHVTAHYAISESSSITSVYYPGTVKRVLTQQKDGTIFWDLHVRSKNIPHSLHKFSTDRMKTVIHLN